MVRASSKKAGGGYKPCLRDGRGKEIVVIDFQCVNRDETTSWNVGATNFAARVLKAVRSPEEFRKEAFGPMPSPVANMVARQPWIRSDWLRQRELDQTAIKLAAELPEDVRSQIVGE